MRKIVIGIVVLCFVMSVLGCSRKAGEREATEESAGRAAAQAIQVENTPAIMDKIKDPSVEIPTPDPAIGGGRAVDEVVNEAKDESMPEEPLGVGDEESENEF